MRTTFSVQFYFVALVSCIWKYLPKIAWMEYLFVEDTFCSIILFL